MDKGKEIYKNIIDNLETYLNPEENGFNQNSKIITEKFQDNKTLLQIIEEKLEQLNNEHSITKSEYKDIWKMFTGYWLLILLFTMGIYALLKMLGLGSAPRMIFNMIKSQINLFSYFHYYFSHH